MCHSRRHHHHRETVVPVERDDPALRASDAERERTVTQLREHGAAGRLEVEELEQRVGAAYQARTRGDLEGLLGDLPRAARAIRPRRAHLGGHEWGTFARVSLLLVAIWAVTGAGYFWPAWVMVWWGFALTMRTAPRLLRLR